MLSLFTAYFFYYVKMRGHGFAYFGAFKVGDEAEIPKKHIIAFQQHFYGIQQQGVKLADQNIGLLIGKDGMKLSGPDKKEISLVQLMFFPIYGIRVISFPIRNTISA